MSAPNDGGPAFPNSVVNGMSLRDYFAGQALGRVIAVSQQYSKITPLDVATESYIYADAMIAARTKSAPSSGGAT